MSMTHCHTRPDGIEAQPILLSNRTEAHWGEYPPIYVGQYPVERMSPVCFYVYARHGRSSGAVRRAWLELASNSVGNEFKAQYPELNRGGIST